MRQTGPGPIFYTPFASSTVNIAPVCAMPIQPAACKPTPCYALLHHCCPLLPLPDTEAPSLPNCLPRPDLGLTAGGEGAGASLSGTGGTAPARPAGALELAISGASIIRMSPTPSVGLSSRSPPNLCARLARSCTLRNFSSSSPQRMMPSSRPLSLLDLSNDDPLGVVALLRGAV